MTVADLVDAMEQIAPTRYAESWDNVGLLIGDEAATVTKVGLCIDYAPDVAAEIAAAEIDAVVAYHPPIFKPIKSLTTGVVFDAARRGLAIYSPHTALDVAPGGTNDVLADAVGMSQNRKPLKTVSDPAGMKLVTFVPADQIDDVVQALCHAGAGIIGDYDRCTFRTLGTGTFRGNDNANPAVGERGKLEHVDEVRLETVVPDDALSDVVAALRAAHPYEEPAFDLFNRAAIPAVGGLGRIGELAEPTDVPGVVDRLKHALGLEHVLVAGPSRQPVEIVAVCAGSCGELLDAARNRGANLYITGEMRHHDALAAANAGMAVICTLHSNSERATLAVLAARLRETLGVDVMQATTDRDPFTIT